VGRQRLLLRDELCCGTARSEGRLRALQIVPQRGQLAVSHRLLFPYRLSPAFNLANYAIIGGNFPTANVFFDEGLASPKTNEFTVSLGRELPSAGYVKAVYAFRKTSDFIEDVIADPSANGKVTVEQGGRVYGIVDKVLWQNTDVQKRQYQALQFMSRACHQPDHGGRTLDDPAPEPRQLRR
jgi:hypothetical protein